MRRLRLVLLLGLAGLGPGPARADLVYVLNSADAAISVLDSMSGEEVRRIPVLREVHHLILTRDRTELMVGDSAGNEMIFIDPTTAVVVRRERFSNPYHMELSPDGRLLVVTSLRRDQVDIYDAATHTLLTRLKVPDKPSHLAFTPDSRVVFVTLQGARGLMAIDLTTRRPLWIADVGSQPAGVIWNRGRLLVGVMGSDHLAVVNPADGRVERTIHVGRGAHTVFPAPDGRLLYVTSRVDSRITVLDAETLELRASWPLPGGPDCIAFDPQGRLWVTLRWIARVAVLDPADGRAEIFPVGRSPHGIFVQARAGPLDPPVLADSPPPPAPAASAPVAVIPVAAVPARADPLPAPAEPVAARAEPVSARAGTLPAEAGPVSASPWQPATIWRRLFGR